MKLPRSGLFCVGSFLITTWLSLVIISLFRGSLPFLFHFGSLCIFLGICSFHLGYLICWHKIVHICSYNLVAMFPLSLLILLRSLSFFSFLANLAKALSILLIFLKTQHLLIFLKTQHFIDYLIVFPFSTLFTSALVYYVFPSAYFGFSLPLSF